MPISISIIIPIYNVAPYITACLQSVMAQTYQGTLECILVDDCGTDNSVEIAERLIGSYKGPIRFRILHHDHNRGLSAARNSGIRASAGDYLFFLDSDDELTANGIQKLAEPIGVRKFDIVVGNMDVIGDNKLAAFLKMKLNNDEQLAPPHIFQTYRYKWNMMAQGKLYRREFLTANGLMFKEGLIHEDELWSFQIACLAKSLFAVSISTYIYKIRPLSITTEETDRRKQTMMQIVVHEMQSFARLHHLHNDNHVHRFIQNIIISMLRPFKGEVKGFVESYIQYRKGLHLSWHDCLIMNGWNIKNQIRDFHYMMPPILGAFWFRFLYVIIRKRNK